MPSNAVWSYRSVWVECTRCGVTNKVPAPNMHVRSVVMWCTECRESTVHKIDTKEL